MALSPLRRVLAAIAATALVSAGLVLGTAGAASAATVTVPAAYTTIAAAHRGGWPGRHDQRSRPERTSRI